MSSDFANFIFHIFPFDDDDDHDDDIGKKNAQKKFKTFQLFRRHAHAHTCTPILEAKICKELGRMSRF